MSLSMGVHAGTLNGVGSLSGICAGKPLHDEPMVNFGAVAQLGERLVRNEEVSGSIPLSSTKAINKSPGTP
jgi:hypothetical protein